MKKKLTMIFVICLLVVTAFCLSACNGDKDDDKNKIDFANDTFTVESAYAQAQGMGFEGTLDEFIEMLSGKNGTDGIGIKTIKVDENGNLSVTLSNDLTIDCGKVRGADGKPGENGKDGVDGKPGENGKDGTNGKDGVNGKDGYDGLSAYELYVAAYGYEGTEEEWLDDLVNNRLCAVYHQVVFQTPLADIDNQKVRHGEKIKKPTEILVNPGYIFDGWYCGDEKWVFSGYTVTEDIILTDKWVECKHEKQYDAEYCPDCLYGHTHTFDTDNECIDRQCNVCHGVVRKSGHVFDVNYSWYCTDKTCTKCGEFVPAIGWHSSDENGVCTYCHKQVEDEYEHIDGGYRLVKHYIGTNVVVPETHKGEPVIEIDLFAVSGIIVESISIPKTVKRIFMSSAANICEWEYEELDVRVYSKLETITVDEENEWYKVINGCLVELSTETLIWATNTGTIPTSGVKKLGMSAFLGRTQSELIIPDNIESLGMYSLSGMSNIKSFYVPASVTNLDAWVFFASSATSIIFDKNSPLTMIPSSTFYAATQIESIVLPKNLEIIGSDCFHGCLKLSIVILKTVNLVGSCAFIGVKSVTFEDCEGWYKHSTNFGYTCDSEFTCEETFEKKRGLLIKEANSEILVAIVNVAEESKSFYIYKK